jgi:hypothetical protein
MNLKKCGRKGPWPIEVLYRIFPGGTEEKYTKPHLLEQVSVTRFKPGISRTRIKSGKYILLTRYTESTE